MATAADSVGVAIALVGDIQRARRQQGAHDLVVDSRVGPATDGAVRGLQRRHEMAPDGVAGPQTLRAIGLADGEATAADDPTGG